VKGGSGGRRSRRLWKKDRGKPCHLGDGPFGGKIVNPEQGIGRKVDLKRAYKRRKKGSSTRTGEEGVSDRREGNNATAGGGGGVIFKERTTSKGLRHNKVTSQNAAN